jgi:hypothetical protein
VLQPEKAALQPLKPDSRLCDQVVARATTYKDSETTAKATPKAAAARFDGTEPAATKSERYSYKRRRNANRTHPLGIQTHGDAMGYQGIRGLRFAGSRLRIAKEFRGEAAARLLRRPPEEK